MSGSYFWQGGRKVLIEESKHEITIHADDKDRARESAARAGVPLGEVSQVAPDMVRAAVLTDRDNGMRRLREEHVVHHVYQQKDQPGCEYLITDTLFVKFKPHTSARVIEQYLRDEHLEVVENVGDGTLLVRVTDETGRNAIKTANSAAQREDVEYAEPNLVRTLERFSFIPADPYFSEQWHLHAPQDANQLVAGAGIFAADAWDVTRGIREVVVCVADDGFDLSHPDFSGDGKIAGQLNARAVGQSVVFEDDVSPRPGDYHGTPCAGVAIAEQNGQGTVGVAPGCAFLAVRFPLSFTDSQMIKLFERISREADVVSCSWGYGPGDFAMSRALSDAISELARTGGRRGKGLVICVAAGNNNCPVQDLQNTRQYEFLDRFGRRTYSGPIDRWIAAHPDVITVSGSTSEKKRSCYSSWGRQISVCAPTDNWDDMRRFRPSGRGIVTTDNEGAGAESDFTPGSRYTTQFGGTSSATPTVAGVCGLVISRNRNLSGKDVKRIIEQTADKDLLIGSETDVNEPGDFVNGFSLWFGNGKINAAKAITAAGGSEDTETLVEKASDTALDIPDSSGPITSELRISEQGVISDIRIVVDIRHTYIGDLRVDLIAPDGTAVSLHNHTGGGMNDIQRAYGTLDVPALNALRGKQVQGAWSLRVADTWRMDVGTLNSWRIAAKVIPTRAPAIPLDDGRRRRRNRATTS